jgi:Zn-finger nucleic acid-binding protein
MVDLSFEKGDEIMQCPTCKDNALVMTERQGIEIDYCPQCRGVWLDRGELDKIIERGDQQPRHHGGQQGHYGQQHRKKSFWSEIFD